MKNTIKELLSLLKKRKKQEKSISLSQVLEMKHESSLAEEELTHWALYLFDEEDKKGCGFLKGKVYSTSRQAISEANRCRKEWNLENRYIIGLKKVSETTAKTIRDNIEEDMHEKTADENILFLKRNKKT